MNDWVAVGGGATARGLLMVGYEDTANGDGGAICYAKNCHVERSETSSSPSK
jgi:hypothetical protein